MNRYKQLRTADHKTYKKMYEIIEQVEKFTHKSEDISQHETLIYILSGALRQIIARNTQPFSIHDRPLNFGATVINQTPETHHIEPEKVDSIFGELYSERDRLQKELIDLKSLLASKEKVIISDTKHHSLFVNSEEIHFLLKRKFTQCQRKFSEANFKVMQIEEDEKKQDSYKNDINEN